MPCNRKTPKCKIETPTSHGIPLEGDTPECCRKAITEILHFAHDFLTASKIRYWMDFGTLLGSVRAGEIMTYEKDGDISIFEEDMDKLKSLKPVIEKHGYWLDLTYREPGPTNIPPSFVRIRYSHKNHNFIDIFGWKNKSGIMTSRFPLNKTKRFPSYFVEDFAEFDLSGKKMIAPRDTYKFLELRFGKDWTIPKRIWIAENQIKWEDIYEYCISKGWNPKYNDERMAIIKEEFDKVIEENNIRLQSNMPILKVTEEEIMKKVDERMGLTNITSDTEKEEIKLDEKILEQKSEDKVVPKESIIVDAKDDGDFIDLNIKIKKSSVNTL